MFEIALKDIQTLYSGGVSRTGWGGCVRMEDVLLWSKESGLTVQETFDEVGRGLAKAYSSGSLDWGFCDGALNDLFGTLMEFYTDRSHSVEEPKVFCDVYLAFDHSETVEASKAEITALDGVNAVLEKL